MADFHNKDVDSIINSFDTNIESGLKENQVEQYLNKYGKNVLTGKKDTTILKMFISQFKDFLVLILIFASIVSIIMGETLEGVIILAIVILNAVLGVYQENKASNALKALKEMANPLSKVLRNGEIKQIQSELIVPGDIVIIEAGDYIPADLRLFETVNLKIDESALTGESVPVEKDSEIILNKDEELGERINCAYMSTVVTYGRGKGIAVNTGMNTQMGNIANMLVSDENEKTPLQKKLDKFGKILGVVCIIVCAIIFAIGLMRNMPVFDIFMLAVSLAVAAIPEGLTVVVTVVLSMGMQSMVKSNAIIKRLSAVESLGSTTVICSDKTGTLTQNKMTAVKLYDNEDLYDITGTGYNIKGEIINTSKNNNELSNTVKMLAEGLVLCNDSIFDVNKSSILGDPTEGALIVMGKKLDIDKDDINKKYPRIEEIPFDSDRKLMSTFHNKDGKIIMYTKGAPDIVVSRSKFIFKNNEIISFDENIKSNIMSVNNDFADSALRVLAVGYKIIDNIDKENFDTIENDLIFLGLVGMIDPPREEAKNAVELCKHAGIKVKMITGDHKITASAIGRELGIIENEKQSMEGKEIDLLSDTELSEKVKNINVFARVSPEHKVRLVKAIKNNGDIAAMTGDGVNDAPSLKKADIGIAMGITGTDVSKEAADMILTDDNFSSIVNAVEEGRTIYNNIRKVIAYLLACNIGEILLILVAMIIGLPNPLGAVQLLAINLITDAFPAFALGMEKKEKGIMDKPPRNPNESIVDKKMGIAIAAQSISLALAGLISFVFGYFEFYNHSNSIEIASTFCFITIVLGELLRAYSARSENISIFKIKIFSNSFLNKTVIVSVLFLLAAVYIPFFNSVFNTVPLKLTDLEVALLLSFIPMIGGEIGKIISRKFSYK